MVCRLFFISLFLAVSAGAGPGDPVPLGYADLVLSLQLKRQIGVPLNERAALLDQAIAEYKHLLCEKDHLTEDELAAKYQTDENYRNSLLKASHPYRDLFSEINYLASTLISDSVFEACGKQFGPTSDDERAQTRSVIEQRASYMPTCQGAGYTGSIRTLSRIKVDPQTKKEVYAAYPLIFSGTNVAEILTTTSIVVTESSLKTEPDVLGRKLPPYTDQTKLSKDDFNELRQTEELKGEIYEKAVVNSLRTRATLDYQYGGRSMTWIKKDLEGRIAQACKYCSGERRTAILNRTLNAVITDTKTSLSQYDDPRNIVVDLCNHLIDAGYYDYYSKNVKLNFDGKKFESGPKRPPNLEPFHPGDLAEVVVSAPKKGASPQAFDLGDFSMYLPPKPPKNRASGAAMDAAYEYSTYQKKRMQIYQAAVREGGTNLLFMTNAVSEKDEEPDADGNTTYHANLSCRKESILSDTAKIKRAVEEAKDETDKVLKDLQETLAPADFSAKDAIKKNRKAIADMVAANPTAVGQAVADNPGLTGYVCDGLHDGVLASRRKAGVKQLYTWGVVVVGTALTLSGIGAPVGTQLLLAAGTLAASAGGVALQHHAAREAKSLAEAYETQYRGGQSENDFILKLSEDQRREYNELKVTAANLFGVGIDGFGFIGAGLKVFNTSAALLRAMKIAKESEAFKGFFAAKRAAGETPAKILAEFSGSHVAGAVTHLEGDLAGVGSAVESKGFDKGGAASGAGIHTETEMTAKTETVTATEHPPRQAVPAAKPELPVQKLSGEELNQAKGKGKKFGTWKGGPIEDLPPETNAKFRNMSQAEIQAAVDHAEVKAIYKYGVGKTDSFIVELDNGMIGIYKPSNKFQTNQVLTRFSNATNETVASGVDEYFNLGVAPRTARADVFIWAGYKGMTEGSFQLIDADAKVGIRALEAGGKVDKISAIKVDLFDSIIDNADRHVKNFLVKPDGKVIAIDNARSFTEGRNFYNGMHGYDARKPGYTTARRLDQQSRIGMVSPATGEVTHYETFTMQNFYTLDDLKAFLKSGEGVEFTQKLRGTTQASVKDYLRRIEPGLTERELTIYSAKVQRNSRLVLDYVTSVLAN